MITGSNLETQAVDIQHIETVSTSPHLESTVHVDGEIACYAGCGADNIGVNGPQYVNARFCNAEGISEMGSFGLQTMIPVHEQYSQICVYNPPMILVNPHVNLPPATLSSMPLAASAPACISLACPRVLQPIAHPQQAAPSVNYTHNKHFNPRFRTWKEHISRALLISGIPPYLTETQLRGQLEQWGPVRALHADRLPQGVLSVQYFDLRASRKALRDMQNQHLLRQQRFQEHWHAQHGIPFQGYRSRFSSAGADEQGVVDCGKGLLGGHVVWAQYIAAWSLPVPDGHNQGTLVLFNIGADVCLQRLQDLFGKYGHVRELREAPSKRQHKFVEFYDTRDAEAAWTALKGQDVCGRSVNIEFSRQGGPLRKQRCVPGQIHQDRQLSTGQHFLEKGPAMCGWQSDSSSYGFDQQKLLFHGNSPPFPVPGKVMATLNSPSLDDCSNDLPSAQLNWYLSHKKDEVPNMTGAVAGPRRKQAFLRPDAKLIGHGLTRSLQRNRSSARGHPLFEYDEREVFLISGQPRTTLMIKNIPNKYSQQMLLSLLDRHCVDSNSQILDRNEPESAFDFVYLPIDFKNRCNLGYAFVNFTSALATLKFFKAFHAQAWKKFNSRKICDIKYARVQGRQALENHFCNSRFACESLEYLPIVFSPPRKGSEECPPAAIRAAARLMMGTKSSGRPAGGGRAGHPPPSSLSFCKSLPASPNSTPMQQAPTSENHKPAPASAVVRPVSELDSDTDGSFESQDTTG